MCLRTPMFFMAVGLHYQDFAQVEDEDVERILHAWSAQALTSTP